MKTKLICALLVALAASVGVAMYSTLTLRDGLSDPLPLGTWKVLRADAVSLTADGSVTVRRIGAPVNVFEVVDVVTVATNVVYDGWTNIPYTVVSGNTTNRYNNYVATVTNLVITATTNTETRAVAAIVRTNDVATLTLSGGSAWLDLSASNAWLRTGDRLFCSGALTNGAASLILEQ